MNADRVLSDVFTNHEHLAPDAASVLADIQHRLHAQPHRGHVRSLTAIGTAVAVVVIAVGTTLVVNRAHSVGPTQSGPANHVLTLDDKIDRFGVPIGGRFVDRQHGFVVLMRCPYMSLTRAELMDPRFTSQPCQDVLEVTSDGGETFHEHALPTAVGMGASIQFFTFDATHICVAQPNADLLAGVGGKHNDIQATRWVSSDAGATWTKVSMRPGSPVSEIPTGALYINDRSNGMAAVLTPDGIMHPLTATEKMTTVPMGRWWALTSVGGSNFLYEDGNDEHPPSNGGLQISRDAGRTWHPARLPSGVSYPSVIGSDGRWMYALAQAGGGGVPQGVIASKDGGRTWQQMSVPKLTPHVYMGYGVAPQGGVLLDDGSHLWRANGVGAFKRISDTVTTHALASLGPVMVAIRSNGSNVIALATSTDGTHWTNAIIG